VSLTDSSTRFNYDSAMTEPHKPVFEYRAAPPERQNRWGVLLRIFLVLPQALFAITVLYAAGFLTFFAWFYILFTGRNRYHEFNSKALRTYQRFNGYAYFLTSDYPNFSLDEDSHYALTSQLEPGELGRAKVFFRLILMIPVAIVTWVLSYGLALLGFISWLILLVRGILPKPLHNAVVSIIRFNGRVAAYVLLLQDPYPRGLFGDQTSSRKSGDHDATAVLPLSSEAATSDGADTMESADHTLPLGPSGIDATIDATIDEGNVETAQSWRLALTAGSKRLLVFALIIGVVIAGLYVRFGHFHWTVEEGVESNISASSWNSQYRSDVVNLRNATIQYESTFDAQHPNWFDLLSDCQLVQRSYKAFDSVPYYPQVGPDQTLISGLQSIYAGYNDCVTIVPPYKVTKAMPLIASQFKQGRDDLKAFLQQT
jgi:hypothetical protein